MVLGALVALLGLQGLELRALDELFRARNSVEAWQPKIDPRIVLVGVDEPSFRVVGKPFVLWQPELARGIRRLFRAGAAAVGFDIILHPELGGLPPDDPFRAKLEEGEEELGQVVLEHPLVLIQRPAVVGQDLQSSARLHYAAVSRGNVANAHLLQDPDGVVRRLPLDGAIHARLAALVGEVHRGEDMLLNYPGPRDSFPVLSFAQVLEGKPLPDLRGKICIVAPTADSFLDLRSTPYGNMLGGEIHAAGLNTLLTDRPIRPAPPWTRWLLPLAAAVLSGLLAYRWRPLPATLALLLGLAFYWLAALTLFGTKDLWVPIAGPCVAAVLGFAAGYLERYLSVERAQKRTRALFGRFVSPQVMKAILSRPDLQSMGGSRRPITVLFSDLNDFTPTCERLPPEEVIAMLNRYFREMVPIIFRHGGTIKQFVGDEIMVIFGAPEPQDDHAARAVRTGLEMVERLEEMAREGGEGFYQVKIGIHTGEAVVGNVGSEQRSEYAAVGDDVNLAARIEGRAKEMGVSLLVSQETRAQAESILKEVDWVSMGAQKFKGKSEEVTVYQARRKPAP